MSVRLAITLVSYFGETHRVRVLQPTPIIGHLPAARPLRPPRSRLPPRCHPASCHGAPNLPTAHRRTAGDHPEAWGHRRPELHPVLDKRTRQPAAAHRPTCPPAHLPAFDAIIKQRYAASSQTPPGRERARARSARHRTHASPALPASPNLWRYLRAATCWCREVCFVVAGCRGSSSRRTPFGAPFASAPQGLQGPGQSSGAATR